MGNMMCKRIITKALAICCASVMFCGMSIVAFADTQATVAVDSANIRSEASTSADAVGKVTKGATVTITEETTDTSGTSWYKITSGNTTGYVRSDLVTKKETTETSTDSNSADNSSAESSAETSTGEIDWDSQVPEGVTAKEAQYATVSVDAGKVRAGASTKNDIVDTLTKSTQVVITGETTGSSDGKTWYYLFFKGSNGTKSGYIRSDLVKLGDMVPVAAPEETVPEEVVEEVPEVPQDYEVVYTDDGSGQSVWYLYNHIDNTRQKLDELTAYAVEGPKKIRAAEEAAQTMKILAIVLAVVLVIAIIAIIFLIFKLRDAMYEYYDEDDEEYDDDEYDEEEDEEYEDDEEDYSPPKRGFFKKRAMTDADYGVRREREVYEDEEEPVKKPVKRQPVREQKRPVEKEIRYEEENYDVEPPVKSQPQKKAKNFLLDDLDDDFEFEFLNMDNRKK